MKRLLILAMVMLTGCSVVPRCPAKHCVENGTSYVTIYHDYGGGLVPQLIPTEQCVRWALDNPQPKECQEAKGGRAYMQSYCIPHAHAEPRPEGTGDQCEAHPIPPVGPDVACYCQLYDPIANLWYCQNVAHC